MKEPAALKNLRTFAVEEWHKIPTEDCQHLVETSKKRLSAVIAVKRGQSKYWFRFFLNVAAIFSSGVFLLNVNITKIERVAIRRAQ